MEADKQPSGLFTPKFGLRHKIQGHWPSSLKKQE